MSRPFVYVNMAMTVDGKTTSARREYPRFTSPHDREHMDRLRAEADAILLGAGTMRADNPALHVRTPEMRERRLSLGKPAGLPRVLVTASAELPADSRFFEPDEGAGRIVATTESADPGRVEALGDRAEVWRVGEKRVDLAKLLDRLHGRGVERLLVEGGGELNWELVRDDLVDELHVTVAPALLGGREAPTLLEGSGLTMKAQRRLRLIDVHREVDELYLRYALERD
jgi:2,5-diamino-6-(ribosylamino)-4(3H)-pyrimidinone 5'-phosphate reductase